MRTKVTNNWASELDNTKILKYSYGVENKGMFCLYLQGSYNIEYEQHILVQVHKNEYGHYSFVSMHSEEKWRSCLLQAYLSWIYISSVMFPFP